MDPNPNQRIHVKTNEAQTNKGKLKMANGSRPPKHPRSGSPSVPRQPPPQVPQLRNDLHIQRYNPFQGAKYSCGRRID